MNSAEAQATVTAALPTIVAATSEADLIQRLMHQGVSRNVARQVLGFVPEAFGQVLLQQFAPRFPDVYCLVSEVDGSHIILPLADEPIHCAALARAQQAAADQTWDMQLHQAVASRSVVVNAVSSFQEAGENIYGLKFTPLVITWDIGPRAVPAGFVNPLPDFVLPPLNPTGTLAKPAAPAKPWWKFWR